MQRSKRIEKIFFCFPSGVINILTGYKSELIPHLAGHYEVNAIDYCDESIQNRKLIKELCANNVKRFYEIGQNWDWFSEKQNENFKEIEKFTELKTVWQTS